MAKAKASSGKQTHVAWVEITTTYEVPIYDCATMACALEAANNLLVDAICETGLVQDQGIKLTTLSTN